MRGAALWKRPPDLDFNPFVFISRIKVRNAAGDWGFKLMESTALCPDKKVGCILSHAFFQEA